MLYSQTLPLHWISDHRKLFSHFWELLTNTLHTKQKSKGLLLPQCGGHGNLSKVRRILNQMIKLDDLESHFHDWQEPWYFAKPEDTEKLLSEIGFENIRVFLGLMVLPGSQVARVILIL